jgi:hypothetical protein
MTFQHSCERVSRTTKSAYRRLNMNRSLDWPWSWEEEIEWKADLLERDDDFVQELIENAIEDSATNSRYSPDSPPEELSGDDTVEKYLVTA